MDRTESLSHSKWKCKYHVVFIPKRRRKTLYSALRKYLGEVLPPRPAERESNRRRAFDAGPCPHADFDSAEVRSVAGDRLHQGEKRDSSGPGVRRAKAEFCGPTLLGARLLRLHRWSR